MHALRWRFDSRHLGVAGDLRKAVALVAAMKVPSPKSARSALLAGPTDFTVMNKPPKISPSRRLRI